MNDQLKNDPRYINHESRPDLAGEHPQGDRYQLYAFLMFTAAVLIDHFFLGWASRFSKCRSIRCPSPDRFIDRPFWLISVIIRHSYSF